MSELELQDLRQIVYGGGYHRERMHFDCMTNATMAFRHTWATVGRDIQRFAAGEEFAQPFELCEMLRRLARDLGYLEGLGWTLLTARQRVVIGRLRRAVRAAERVARSGDPARLDACRTVCHDRFLVADRVIGFPYWLRPLGETRVIHLESAEPGDSPSSPIRQTESVTWEAGKAAELGERAFAWYRVRCAWRRRRFRSAAQLTAAWLSTFVRRESCC
jgi:hypothetical protein